MRRTEPLVAACGGTSGVSTSRAVVVFAIYAATGVTAAGVALERCDVTV
jgi:hypothetical protein